MGIILIEFVMIAILHAQAADLMRLIVMVVLLLWVMHGITMSAIILAH